MTDAEILHLQREAAAEFTKLETEMLVAPLAVLGLIERLTRCEEQRQAAAAYDQLR